MFKARLDDPKMLKSSIDAVSNMIDEAGVNVTEDGIRLKAMDPAHVALVDLELSKDAFDEYEATEPLVLGLDLERFNTILKRCGSDKIFLQFDSDNNALSIKFKNSSTRTFSLPLIEVSEEELKVPTLEFPCKIEIDPRILSEGIKDAEIVSDHVVLRVDENTLYISAKGDLGNVEVKVSKDEAKLFEVSQSCRSMFSIEYLKDMIKASDVAESVRIFLGDNIPVKMDFIAENARLSFLLAPRIESE
jgi:proliferating cell nuclear antigen